MCSWCHHLMCDLPRTTLVSVYCLMRTARCDCGSHPACKHKHTYMHTHIHAYRQPPRLSSPTTLPPPIRRLTSKPAVILPFVYSHVVWLKKCISAWFHCPLSRGRRPITRWQIGPTWLHSGKVNTRCGPPAHTQKKVWASGPPLKRQWNRVWAFGPYWVDNEIKLKYIFLNRQRDYTQKVGLLQVWTSAS